MKDLARNSPEAVVSTAATGVRQMRRIIFGLLIALMTAGSCNSKTIFKSDFDATGPVLGRCHLHSKRTDSWPISPDSFTAISGS